MRSTPDVPVADRAIPPVADRAIPPDTIEPLYNTAHDLHFHGSDAAAALGAWDAYLAASPGGRFAVEARYNRAVDLVKLGRLAEAQQALAPFVAGEIAPKGYRQVEAHELATRIAKRLDATHAAHAAHAAGGSK